MAWRDVLGYIINHSILRFKKSRCSLIPFIIPFLSFRYSRTFNTRRLRIKSLHRPARGQALPIALAAPVLALSSLDSTTGWPALSFGPPRFCSLRRPLPHHHQPRFADDDAFPRSIIASQIETKDASHRILPFVDLATSRPRRRPAACSCSQGRRSIQPKAQPIKPAIHRIAERIHARRCITINAAAGLPPERPLRLNHQAAPLRYQPFPILTLASAPLPTANLLTSRPTRPLRLSTRPRCLTRTRRYPVA